MSADFDSPVGLEPRLSHRLADAVRAELSGEVATAGHAVGRARLLDALAGAPAAAAAAPSGWPAVGPLRHLGARVAGPLLAAAAVLVAFVGGFALGNHRAEVLLVSGEGRSAEATPAGTAATAAAAPSPATAPAASVAATSPSTAPEPLPSLRQLLERGEAQRVIERVERMGVEACLATCSASDLEAFADAARYTGRNDFVARILPAQRKRFPGTDLAATAAFLLGRSAQASGNDAEAMRWLQTYLRERPGGALAGEAMGRSMQLAQRSGDAKRARAFAEQVLRAAPTGTYAAQAREILSRR